MAKAELLLMRAGCPIRPSSAGVNNVGTKLLFTKDYLMSQGVDTDVEATTPDLTDLIKGSIYNR